MLKSPVTITATAAIIITATTTTEVRAPSPILPAATAVIHPAVQPLHAAIRRPLLQEAVHLLPEAAAVAAGG